MRQNWKCFIAGGPKYIKQDLNQGYAKSKNTRPGRKGETNHKIGGNSAKGGITQMTAQQRRERKN